MIPDRLQINTLFILNELINCILHITLHFFLIAQHLHRLVCWRSSQSSRTRKTTGHWTSSFWWTAPTPWRRLRRSWRSWSSWRTTCCPTTFDSILLGSAKVMVHTCCMLLFRKSSIFHFSLKLDFDYFQFAVSFFETSSFFWSNR